MTDSLEYEDDCHFHQFILFLLLCYPVSTFINSKSIYSFLSELVGRYLLKYQISNMNFSILYIDFIETDLKFKEHFKSKGFEERRKILEHFKVSDYKV